MKKHYTHPKVNLFEFEAENYFALSALLSDTGSEVMLVRRRKATSASFTVEGSLDFPTRPYQSLMDKE